MMVILRTNEGRHCAASCNAYRSALCLEAAIDFHTSISADLESKTIAIKQQSQCAYMNHSERWHA